MLEQKNSVLRVKNESKMTEKEKEEKTTKKSAKLMFEVLQKGMDSGRRTGNMGKDGCGY